jgi:succinoglycan biosynthesis protein ExoM
MEVCIAICTFQRPEIVKTLESVAGQILPSDITCKIIVADNDENYNAKDYIEKISVSLGLDLTYVHAPFRNISIARNACLKNSTSDWFLTIDDDQILNENWISEMVATALNMDADVVLGPVKALYNESTPDWIKQGDFHSHKPVFINGVIQTGYTGNTLIRLDSKYFKGEIFDLKLGRSGGEDSSYFSKGFQKGAKLVYAEKAVVFEPVPESRANGKWLIQRRFRYGQTCASRMGIERNSISFLFSSIGKALCKFGFCSLMSCISFYNKPKAYSWFLRGVLHIGIISKILGKKEIVQY